MVEKKAPKKAVAKKLAEKTVVPKNSCTQEGCQKKKKVVYKSESESKDEAPLHRKSAVKHKVIAHLSCVFIEDID